MDQRGVVYKGKAILKENVYAKPSTIKCYWCLQPDHKLNECPARHQVQFLEAESGNDRKSTNSDNEEYKSEEIVRDEGEPLRHGEATSCT